MLRLGAQFATVAEPKAGDGYPGHIAIIKAAKSERLKVIGKKNNDQIVDLTIDRSTIPSELREAYDGQHGATDNGLSVTVKLTREGLKNGSHCFMGIIYIGREEYGAYVEVDFNAGIGKIMVIRK